MKEVMTLSNVDSAMRSCDTHLNSKEPLSKSKLNLIAIDICRCYGNLLEYIYLCKQEEIPGDKTIQELLDLVLTEKNASDLVKADILAKIPVVMNWENTQLPLPNINTTIDEVREVFVHLTKFYGWVETVYLPTTAE